MNQLRSWLKSLTFNLVFLTWPYLFCSSTIFIDLFPSIMVCVIEFFLSYVELQCSLSKQQTKTHWSCLSTSQVMYYLCLFQSFLTVVAICMLQFDEMVSSWLRNRLCPYFNSIALANMRVTIKIHVLNIYVHNYEYWAYEIKLLLKRCPECFLDGNRNPLSTSKIIHQNQL